MITMNGTTAGTSTTFREDLGHALVEVRGQDLIRVTIAGEPPVELDAQDAGHLAGALRRACAHAKARA